MSRKLSAAVFVLLIARANVLLALNPTLPIGQYQHRSWRQELGYALPPVTAIAQTTDGYMWLGTERGLIRFDGVRFVEWTPPGGEQMPSRNIRSLQSSSDGGLWIGTTEGLFKLTKGHIVHHPKIACGRIASMRENRAGRLLFLTWCPERTTLWELSTDGTVKAFGASDGLNEPVYSWFEDRRGEVWIATSKGMCRWTPGKEVQCFNGPTLENSAIFDDCEGNLLVADAARQQLFRFTDGKMQAITARFRDASFSPRSTARDRDGNVWIGTGGQGLVRISQGRVDRLTVKEELSSNVIYGVFEDREGNLWLATARGIDRLSDPKFQRLSKEDGLAGDLASVVYRAKSGGVWIGITGGGLNRVIGNRISRFPSALERPNASVSSVYEDLAQRLWTGTSEGLMIRTGDRMDEVRTDTGERLARITNIVGTPNGTVWLSDLSGRLYRVREGKAHLEAPPALQGRPVYRLLATSDGAVWAAHYTDCGITVLSPDSATYYDQSNGLAAGNVRALYQDDEGAIWAGTSGGLSRFQNRRWTTWTQEQGLPEGGVLAIVEDLRDGLWLWTPSGVLRIERGSLKGSRKPLNFLLYNFSEGLRLSATGSSLSPTFIRASDGRLWLATQDGAVVFDPARVQRNPIAPPVTIEQFTINGKPADLTRGKLAFHRSDVRIDYTGISLTAPERVQFKYRLHGRDRSWTDAGTQRNINYADLPPGHYRFQVIAANNDGLWNEKGGEVAFVVEPYFYQTTWFATLCALSIALAAWAAHLLKVRSMLARFQLIAAERARFSRELHDSLLQGFAGVVLQLEAAAKQFDTAPEKSRRGLIKALDQADISLREARQLIIEMRIPALDNSSLPEALRTTTAGQVSGMPVNFQFDVKGHVRQGHYNTEANLFLIGREALSNALNHANARRIRMELTYTTKDLSLVVQDDGDGFDPEIARRKSGHQGFRGMEERARGIGGQFSVVTAPGAGSKIEVHVPWKR